MRPKTKQQQDACVAAAHKNALGMGTLPEKLSEEIRTMAEEHAKHLAEYVFIPAYVSGFTHGAKHLYERLTQKEAKNG